MPRCKKEAAIGKKIPESKIKALRLAEFVLEKKARKPLILDVKGSSGLCDYFVICSAETGVQVEAICEWVIKRCKEFGYRVHHFENDELSRWILIDLFDVMLHIFTDEAREFYNLEFLWSQGKRVRVTKKKKSENFGEKY